MKKLIIFLLLLLVTTAGAYTGIKPILGEQINWTRPPLSKGLVGCWLMNEGAGSTVLDSSGNGNDGTLVGTVNWTSGKFGSALDLAGGNDDYVVCGAFNTTQAPCTISLWTFWTGTATEYVFDHENPRFALFTVGTDTLRFYHDADIDIGNLTKNLWHHLVLTFSDTGYLNFYLDGVLTYSGDTNLTTTDLFAGSFYWGTRYSTAQSFDGILDLPIIFNRVLTASETTQLYREPFCMFRPSFDMFLYGALAVPTVGGQVIFVNVN